MPIRVNLKELFPADSQELAMDKLNFNFNKLLELGVGEVGPVGQAGPQGAAGPVGATGSTGQRGNTWLVDSGNPDTHTFNDLLDGDFYLDTASFAVWQWSAASPAIWTEIVDFEAIVNYYISLSPSPFNRATSTTNSPGYDRFITFNRRGNTLNDIQSDISRGQFNTSDNDVLFLTNYNELLLPTAISNFPTNSGELYDALLKISVNHTEASSEQTGRYHFELSSIYLDETASPAELKISELKHNLKAKFVKTNVSATSPIPNTNTWMNIAQFSLSVPEPDPIIGIDQNGIFEWVTPKYNNEGGSPLRSEVTMMFGAEEGLTEFSANAIVGDGIDISTLTDSFSAGIKYNLEDSLILPYAAGEADFAFFNVSDGLNGFFFNDKLVQTGGNIEQIHTYPAKYETKYTNLSNFSPYANKGLPSVYTNGQYLIHTAPGSATVPGTTAQSGAMHIYTVNKEINALQLESATSNYTTGVSPTYDNHGHQTNLEFTSVPTVNVTDVAIAGKYMYFTRIAPSTFSGLGYQAGNFKTFIIAEKDSDGADFRPVGFAGPSVAGSANGFNKYNALHGVEIVGSTAFIMSQKSSFSGGSWGSVSTLISLDISSPANILELDTYAGSSSDVYLDFAISRERAFIINFNDISNNLQIRRVDISLPDNIVGSTSVTTVVTGTTQKPTSIKIQNEKLFTVYGSKLYAYSINEDNATALPSLITNGFEINSSFQLVDVITNDDYLYVLGENTTNGAGAVFVLDISTISSPVLISTLTNNELTAPSRMTQIGNKLYIATSKGTSSLSSINGGLVIVSVEGVRAATANISTIKASNITSTGNVWIGERLDVGHSVNIGSGGLYVNGGAGISTNGTVKVAMSDPYKYYAQADTPFVNLVDLEVNHDVVDASGVSYVNFLNASLSGGTYETKVAGANVTVNSGVQAQSDVYGYKFDFNGTNAGSGKVYGLHIEGAEENIIEGKLTVNSADNYIASTSVPAIASQVADTNVFMSGYVDTATYDYAWTRVGNIVTCTGRSTATNIPIPIGQIDTITQRVHGTGSWSGSDATIRVKYSNATSIDLVRTSAEGTDISGNTKHYTFSYVID